MRYWIQAFLKPHLCTSSQSAREKECLSGVAQLVQKLRGMDGPANHFAMAVKFKNPIYARNYNKIVPRKDQRDLTTIVQNLANNNYTSALHVNADIRQVS